MEHGDREPAVSAETQLELDELAARRALALGQPVAVVGFASSGRAHVLDVTPDGLVDQGAVPITPTPPE